MDIALEDGSAFKLDGWKYISEAFPSNTLHFIGLLSDGGVHSRYDQLIGFVKGAAKDGAKRIRVHILTVSACTSGCASPCRHLICPTLLVVTFLSAALIPERVRGVAILALRDCTSESAPSATCAPCFS